MLCFKGQLLPTRWLAWGHRGFLLWFLDFSRACLLLSRKCFSSYYVHILTNILSACLVTGVIAEKGRLLPFLVFAFFWTCFVYDPIAYWMWNSQGWANRHGALDWAGGTYEWHQVQVAAPLGIGMGLTVLFGVYEWLGRKDGLVAHVFFKGNNNFALATFAFAVEG